MKKKNQKKIAIPLIFCRYHRVSGSNGLVISPKYPYHYSNGTCDKRIFVGSSKDIDLHFIDINLKSDSGLGQCKSGSAQDHIEIRGRQSSCLQN